MGMEDAKTREDLTWKESNSLCTRIQGPPQECDTYVTFNCQPPLAGKYVFLQRMSNDSKTPFSIAELELIETEPGEHSIPNYCWQQEVQG